MQNQCLWKAQVVLFWQGPAHTEIMHFQNDIYYLSLSEVNIVCVFDGNCTGNHKSFTKKYYLGIR